MFVNQFNQLLNWTLSLL